MKPKKKYKRVEWKYCECGCHGHGLQLGHVYYWMLNDLGRGANIKHFHLRIGHGVLGKHLGSFMSFEEADRAARAHARPIIKKHLQELKRAEASV